MKSLLDQNTCNEVLNRLYKSNEEMQASWGKMNVSQMLNHCQLPLKIALKSEPIKSSFNPIMRLFKKSMYNDSTWRKNLPTAKGFVIKETKNFKQEKEALKSMIVAFQGKKLDTEWNPHPLFGKFTPEQWGKMQYKHLDHHFHQFGFE
jgi:hypothetical protein|tara:strand:- start:13 stop:456 length:444 start_codon:yes stop_codon:yes gene_type:complete